MRLNLTSFDIFNFTLITRRRDREKHKLTRQAPGALDPAVVLPPPLPRGVKYVTVTQNKSPWLCSERHDEYFFGRTKAGGLGQVTPPPQKKTTEIKGYY